MDSTAFFYLTAKIFKKENVPLLNVSLHGKVRLQSNCNIFADVILTEVKLLDEMTTCEALLHVLKAYLIV